ncbi:MAG: Coenzyme F420 hydrogenase/dehydrogenase, beta subunit C-terminal domain [Dehalococcoidia bacterium]|jgi:coenzyme F420 hydrogenase subunit beta
MSPEIMGCRQLRDEVIDRGLCTLCGACVGMCPYLVAYRGRVVPLDDCNIERGRCHAFCPRTATDLDAVSDAVFGTPFDTGAIGRVAEVLMARASGESVRSRAQYGGTVSALAAFAIDRGLVQGAVVTTSDEQMLPGGVLVRDAEQVVACARSNYVAAPTLAAFNREARREDVESVAVVATPCQALALGKMRASPLENRNNIDKLGLVIGLFCTWALAYEDFARFLAEQAALDRISKLDIPPPPANVFQVFSDSVPVSIPLDDVRRFIRPTCNVCLDLTAEFADIAVGAAEGIDGWNTLIVRSERGRELVDAARGAGILEVDALPQENLDHLKQASLGKRKRALENIRRTTGSGDDLLYLDLSPETRERLLST